MSRQAQPGGNRYCSSANLVPVSAQPEFAVFRILTSSVCCGRENKHSLWRDCYMIGRERHASDKRRTQHVEVFRGGAAAWLTLRETAPRWMTRSLSCRQTDARLRRPPLLV